MKAHQPLIVSAYQEPRPKERQKPIVIQVGFQCRVQIPAFIQDGQGFDFIR